MKHTIIIGAGLTGLTAAHYLKKAGKDVLLIEKADRVGGVINTIEKAGFAFETGPNTGVLGNPEAAELFEDLKHDVTLEIANPEAKRRLIWKKGKWNALPSGPISAIKTPLFTFADKLRVLGEPWRKKGDNPHETLADLVRRRLGKSFLNYAIDPFISGIYAGDPEKLIPKYALPKLYALEQNYGSFIGGSIQKKKLPKTDRDKLATREVFSAEGGLVKLIDALEKSVGSENIILNAGDSKIEKTETGYKVTVGQKVFEGQNIISTCGAYTLGNLLPFLSSEDLAAISNLEYAKVVQVIIGYKNWTGSDIKAFGGLVPTIEKKDILGILFTSSFLKNRAPEKGTLLSIFLGGTKKPHLFEKSDNELKTMIDEHLQEMMQVKLGDADFVSIHRYPHAIPQYTVSSKERFEAIEKIQNDNPGLILAGNIRNGIGMADRIKQARETAAHLIK